MDTPIRIYQSTAAIVKCPCLIFDLGFGVSSSKQVVQKTVSTYVDQAAIASPPHLRPADKNHVMESKTHLARSGRREK